MKPTEKKRYTSSHSSQRMASSITVKSFVFLSFPGSRAGASRSSWALGVWILSSSDVGLAD